MSYKRERRKDGMAHFLPEELRRTAEWETAARQFLNELDRLDSKRRKN